MSEFLSRLTKKTPAVWQLRSEEFTAEVTTPIGFSFKLEIESQSVDAKL